MASDISGLLLALKQWQKAVDQLRKKGTSSQEKDQTVEKARQKVLQYLETEPITHQLDALIQRAIAPESTSVEEIREILVKHPQPLVSVELRTVRPLAVSNKDLETLIETFLRTPDQEKTIANSQELKDIFGRISLAVPQQYKATIPLSRKAKKRRRRDWTLGVLHTVLGLGLLAGNTQLNSDAANASYILGGNALVIALQNLVGSFES